MEESQLIEKRKIQEVERYIERLPEDIQIITDNLREIILNASQDLIEEYKWSMPNYSYKGLVCYIQSSKKHVNLGFHKGIELQEKDVNHYYKGQEKVCDI